MAQGKEAKLQRKIQKYINSLPRTVCWKMHGGPHMPKGLSDIIGCHKGRFFAFEVKVPGRENTLTEIQQAKLEAVEAAGGIAAVVTSVDEAKEVFRSVRKKKAKGSA